MKSSFYTSLEDKWNACEKKKCEKKMKKVGKKVKFKTSYKINRSVFGVYSLIMHMTFKEMSLKTRALIVYVFTG